MAQWEPLVGGIFGSEILNPLSGVIDTVQSVLGPIQTILSLIQSILSIIRVFLIDAASLLLAVIQTLVDEITKFIDSLANAGLYYLVVGLQGATNTSDYISSMTGGFNNFVSKIVDSFDDVADPQRPIFSSSERCGGVIYALSSGNIADAISFVGLFLRQANKVFSALYVPPVIHGFAANQTNVVVFERPNIPQNFFSNITFHVVREESSAGTPVTRTATNNASKTSTVEPQTDSQNPGANKKVNPTVIATINQTLGDAFTLSPQRYVIVDGPDTVSPHLIKFDLTKKASSRASVDPTSPRLGPKTFTLKEASGVVGNILGNVVPSTVAQLDSSGAVPTGSQGDAFREKVVNGYWLDFRINGYSLPTTDPGNGGLFVQSYDGSTVTLSSNVPLGAKVVAYTYVQAKTADIVLQQDLNAGHASTSVYTKVITNNNTLTNNKPYFYRVEIIQSDGSVPTGGRSNQVTLTPRSALAPNPPPAYCLSGKSGPFVIPPGKNTLSFSVGNRTYNVALRPSRINKFSTDVNDFYSGTPGFGLALDPQFQSTVTATNLSAQTAQAAAQNIVTGAKGLVFQYVDYSLKPHVILPGQYIPVEVDDILLDLETQCGDGNVRFFVQKGRIGIQDMSRQAAKSSSVVINAGLANDILGYTVGPCMNVAYSEPPDWGRIAVKDIFPQIYTLAEIIQGFANGVIAGIESGVKSLVDFIDLLSTKIKVLQDFLDQINNLLNTLKNLKLQLPNMYKLEIPAGNGVQYLKTAISGATNRPVSSPNDLTVGFVLVIGGPFTDAVLPLLLKIL